MTELLRYALLGLGTGGIYALLGLGLVVIYRGSGVINFAHAGFALVGAYLTYELQTVHGLGLGLSLGTAVLATALLGVLTHHLVLRPLRSASPLARVIATLGILTILTEAIQLKYGAQQLRTESPLPNEAVTVTGDVVVGQYAFWLVGIAAVVTLALTLAGTRTKVGYAISAAAENSRGAAALGWAPDLLASITWAIGGGLAALAGGLFPSTTFGFISPVPFGVLIIGALATALLGGFRSYPLALLGGLALGAAQSATRHWTDQTGVSDAVPFLAIIVVLVLRGRGLPLRGTITDRLPRVGTGRVRPGLVVVLAGGALLWIGLGASVDWYAPTIISTTFALVGLSVVLLTGYAGQLSIAQFALAGIGAFAAGRLAVFHGWPFELALVAGVVVAMLVGLLFGLPALRTRGVNLAVVTFGLGFAVHQIVFSNSDYTANVTPREVRLLGIDIEPIDHARNYALVCLVALVLVSLLVANVRRGRSGRRLLAVRTNERAAAAIGVNVFEAKLYAFTLSAGIAGLGGVLLGFSYATILYPQLFQPGASITVLVSTVIGSTGYLAGPFIGAISAPGGLITLLGGNGPATASAALQDGTTWQSFLPLASGLVLILTLIASQHGVAESIDASTRGLRSRIPGLRPAKAAPLPATERSTVAPRSLEVRGLTQRFGVFTALDDVSLTVAPGQVVGLLGPNGAGKTTLIDCVSGNNRLSGGTISWDGRDVTRWAPYRRARAGLSRSFQSLELFDDLTVRENLLAAADRRDRLAYLTDLVHPGRSRMPATVVAAVEELGLAPLLDTRAEDLSYGQRRLVAIARAVASSPSVLLLDEPAAGLDETESAELGRLVRRLADEWGMGILLIEHDVALVLENADRVVVLDFGRVIAEGAPAEVRTDPAVRRAYLGEEAAPEAEAGSPVSVG
ncbi:ATP-binding cassette domain-containing protein [Nocardioides albidus]|uniref:ATP-binding cassette domain-containing protein n=1 Tax=Nocardioides albidus TaxID=1517589 RepID=A0A5C4VN77_9ACTN|nr:branched-chain amino acid ABC transporter permease/ATP-binding protein [Nocardioides albidus]TNM37360.1 ATP-binding cassette domain-containing protein [Nocardioides albidus]